MQKLFFKLTLISFSLVLFFTTQLDAQSIKYSFKVGLNFSKFNAPVETDQLGNALEEFKTNVGFHAGGGIRYQFSKKFGVGLELMYSQKGGKNFFDSDSAYVVIKRPNNLASAVAYGTKTENNRISISYIDLPLTFYYKIKKFELSAGANIAFNVNATGTGESTFKGLTTSGGEIKQFITSFDHNYVKNVAGEFTSVAINNVVVDGDQIAVPASIGAYYFYPEKSGNYYNLIDLGLNAGLAYYFNDALYFGIRANYGLSDVTNNFYDRSTQLLDPQNNYIKRNDFDRNLSFQGSIGFSF